MDPAKMGQAQIEEGEREDRIRQSGIHFSRKAEGKPEVMRVKDIVVFNEVVDDLKDGNAFYDQKNSGAWV